MARWIEATIKLLHICQSSYYESRALTTNECDSNSEWIKCITLECAVETPIYLLAESMSFEYHCVA